MPKLETPFKVYIYCTLPRKSGDSFLVGGKHPVQGKIGVKLELDEQITFESEIGENENQFMA